MRFTEPGPVSENRRYFYISFLRDPVSRYLSEWRHVARGATWDGAELKCGGVEWGQRLPRCWGGEEDWKRLTNVALVFFDTLCNTQTAET